MFSKNVELGSLRVCPLPISLAKLCKIERDRTTISAQKIEA